MTGPQVPNREPVAPAPSGPPPPPPAPSPAPTVDCPTFAPTDKQHAVIKSLGKCTVDLCLAAHHPGSDGRRLGQLAERCARQARFLKGTSHERAIADAILDPTHFARCGDATDLRLEGGLSLRDWYWCRKTARRRSTRCVRDLQKNAPPQVKVFLGLVLPVLLDHYNLKGI